MCRIILSIFLFLIGVARLNAVPLHYIISGGPGVGKTSVARCLATVEFPVVPEIFTELYDAAQANPQIGILYANILWRMTYLITTQIQREKELDPSKTVFLDRSALDCLFFADYYRIPINRFFLPKIFGQQNYYNKTVFFLEQLPRELYQQTSARQETYEQSLQAHIFLMNSYLRQGFTVVVVPFAAPEVRAQFIINHIHEQCAKVTA